jgi:hypothetical protein
MASLPDLVAATRDNHNHDIYREQCELEIVSTFSFQSNLWLSDVAPALLTTDQIARLAVAKVKAKSRTSIEATIPRHLLYESGWPNVMPTFSEATLLAQVRREVASIMRFNLNYTDPTAVLNRYAALLKLKEERPPPKLAS